MKILPDYKKIYADMISLKYPEKAELCNTILKKKKLSVMDLIKLNNYLAETVQSDENQKFKSYDRNAIFEILEYQKKFNLNNTQLANHFKLSRNTITKWKKLFFNFKDIS